MKLRAIHLFFILILSLLFGSWFCNVPSYSESMTTMGAKTGSYTGDAGDTVDLYDNMNSSSSSSTNDKPPPPPPAPAPPKGGGFSATTYTTGAGGSATKVTGPQGNTAVAVSPATSGSQIPPGDEDKYILKSEVVPPVCPACPSNASCPRPQPPPPCPPCARCPEPAFECKKVPNYKAADDNYMPKPILNDFSSFGM